jgi:prepilin-type N-terminal cleavage/methylation domain-containing protein
MVRYVIMSVLVLCYRTRVCGRAFTLVELLIVIVVLCVMATLVLPASGGSDEARLLEAGRFLVADLDQARMYSLCSAADRCLVSFDADGRGYHLARESDPVSPIREGTGGRAYARVFGHGEAASLSGVLIDAGGVGSDRCLGFTGLGRLDQGSDATILLEYAGRRVKVVVDAGTGEARVQP